MGLYSRYIFPRFCDWAMRNPRIARLRTRCSPRQKARSWRSASGLGSTWSITRNTSVTSRRSILGEGMARIARRRIERSDIDVDLRVQTAEEMPFEDGRFDCVVSTWTMCSIREAQRAVSEIGRVLRPGGRYIFLEHGLGDDPGIQRWQRRLTPLQRIIAGGCRLDVDIEALVRTGPFNEIRVERFLLEGTPRIMGSMYRGVAMK